MSLLRFIAVAGIFMCATQRHIICAMKQNGNTWLAIGTNEVLSYFIEHKNRILDVEKISTFVVGLISECALRCARIVTCLSFNIEDASVKRRAMRCELLSQDKNDDSLQFHKSEAFHHWTKITPCSHSPCKNGGTCVPDYNRGLYECLCPIGYHGNTCQLFRRDQSHALGSHMSNPGLSCKDISDRRGHSLKDGGYWITPHGINNPFTVYCDMTTDGGGWTLLKRTTIPANPSDLSAKPMVVVNDYTAISNYTDEFLFVSIKGIDDFRQAVNFHQLRWYCFKKQQGSVFHIMTKNDSAGYKVLDYFLKLPSRFAQACGSFDRLPDDNSTLSQNCHKWGACNDTLLEMNQWGSYTHNGRNRIYRDIAESKSDMKVFSFRLPAQFWCDDHGGMETVSQGDKWEVYAR